MKLKNLEVTAFEISDVKALDPITVYIENHEAGKGRITIICYTSSWTAYWGAMSGRSIEEFFIDCDVGYLSSNLMQSSELKQGKSNVIYLMRIIPVVQNALRELFIEKK